jgi:hypothetical protein
MEVLVPAAVACHHGDSAAGAVAAWAAWAAGCKARWLEETRGSLKTLRLGELRL